MKNQPRLVSISIQSILESSRSCRKRRVGLEKLIETIDGERQASCFLGSHAFPKSSSNRAIAVL